LRAPDRLGIALFTYATQPRGGVLHALALAEALHARGQRAVLYALAEPGATFIREPRCPFVLVPSAAPRGDVLAYVRTSIDAYVDGLDGRLPAYDIYHAHDGISSNALATLVERGRIARFMRTVHHLDDFGTGELAALQQRSVRSAAGLLVVSETWRQHLARAFAREATVVPNGVDASRFVPAAPALRTQLRARWIGADGPLFVTIGGIEARKNSLAILEAFAQLRARRPQARLIIGGGASVLNHSAYRRRFDARAAELGLAAGGALTITGVLRDADVVELVQAADALAFPSLVEGFGLVVLEALACGTPVVASAIAPFTEYLRPSDALLVDPHDSAAIADALLRACEPATAAALGAAGRRVAERSSWNASAHAHERAYRAFLAAESMGRRGVPLHA